MQIYKLSSWEKYEKIVFIKVSGGKLQFDEIFMWNCNLKIIRQIDLVLYYLAYECCNLTNFSCEIAI